MTCQIQFCTNKQKQNRRCNKHVEDMQKWMELMWSQFSYQCTYFDENSSAFPVQTNENAQLNLPSLNIAELHATRMLANLIISFWPYQASSFTVLNVFDFITSTQYNSAFASMPTLVDYLGVSRIQTESPVLPYEAPNLPDKTNKSA